MVGGQPIQVGFWDTAGQEEYDVLRPLSYPQTDVFGLMFALGGENAEESLEHIASKWIPEAKERTFREPVARVAHASPPPDCPDKPMVMIGLKSDLQDDAILEKGALI